MSRKQVFWLLINSTIIYLVFLLRSAIFPFAISFLIAYLFLPLVNFFEKKKISRSFSSLLLVLSLFFLLVAIFTVFIPFMYNQIYNISLSMPEYIKMIKNILIPKIIHHHNSIEKSALLNNIISNTTDVFVSFVNSIVLIANKTLWKSSLKIINVFSFFFISPLITFYLLRDWRKIKIHIFDLIPHRNRETVENIINDVDKSISGYIRGQLNVCAFFSCFYSALLSILHLHFALPLGIMIGILTFIPFLGFVLSFLTTIAIAIIQFGLDYHVLLVLSVFIFGQLLDTNLITPKFIGEKIGLHPNWIVFGLFASVAVFGLIGSIMALPLTASLAVGVRFIVKYYKNSNIYKEE